MPLASAALLCLVVAVSDGDTLKVLCQDSDFEPKIVRLAAIDAPESNQPFGQRARKSLSEMTLRKPVRLECRDRKDRYGRLLCTAWVTPASCTRPTCEMTLDAGHAMLTIGLAWWESRFAREQAPQQRGQYEFSQFEARSRRAGLWRDAEAVPPWEWRQLHPTRPRWPGRSPAQ
jgi:endonuclease YncB( thermonuclease family)